MRQVFRRLVLTAMVLLLLLIVVRALVVPLARQRQEHRRTASTSLALLPAEVQAWCLQRNNLRRAPRDLLPDATTRFRERAESWGLPLRDLAMELALRDRWSGEWLCARRDDGAWLLAGSRARLRSEGAVHRALSAAPDTLITLLGGASVSGREPWFLVVSDPGLLEGGSWLAAAPDWLELGDLLLGGDWLEFRAEGQGGHLLAFKSLLDCLLCEGLSWGVAGVAPLTALCPGPPATEPAPELELAATPLLRRSGPFTPGGDSMPQIAGLRGAAGELRSAERQWQEGGWGALARVVRRP